MSETIRYLYFDAMPQNERGHTHTWAERKDTGSIVQVHQGDVLVWDEFVNSRQYVHNGWARIIDGPPGLSPDEVRRLAIVTV